MVSEDEFNHVSDFVEFFVRKLYVGTCKSIIQTTGPSWQYAWTMDRASLPPEILLQTYAIFQTPKTYVRWGTTQLDQSKALLSGHLAGAQVPFLQQGFLRSWLSLSHKLHEEPVCLMRRVLDDSLKVATLIKDRLVRDGAHPLSTKRRLEERVSELVRVMYTEPPQVVDRGRLRTFAELVIHTLGEPPLFLVRA